MSVYRIDIVKNGERWQDPVGVSSTADDIAATAVTLVAEAALETVPAPGFHCVAEVYDKTDRLVLKATLHISD